jgi:hypothetical protein
VVVNEAPQGHSPGARRRVEQGPGVASAAPSTRSRAPARRVDGADAAAVRIAAARGAQ